MSYQDPLLSWSCLLGGIAIVSHLFFLYFLADICIVWMPLSLQTFLWSRGMCEWLLLFFLGPSLFTAIRCNLGGSGEESRGYIYAIGVDINSDTRDKVLKFAVTLCLAVLGDTLKYLESLALLSLQHHTNARMHIYVCSHVFIAIAVYLFCYFYA